MIDDLISRRAAIAEVKEAYENDEMLDGYEYRLQELPSAQAEPCEDTVSRQRLLSDLKELVVAWEKYPVMAEQIKGVEAAIGYVETIPTAQPEPPWIPCSERMPECEQEVLICTKIKLVGKDAYIDSIITPALYEDGTMLENESKWHWEDVDYEKWDEEEDCGVIPEGWWENRHFNLDGEYNNLVDREVVAWMPLPEPYRKEE